MEETAKHAHRETSLYDERKKEERMIMFGNRKKFLLPLAALMCVALFAASGPSTDTAHAAHYQSNVPGTVPLYRLYQPTIIDHFYTTNISEAQNARQHLGYNDEGVAARIWPSQASDTVPLYRLYSPGATDHFYTTNSAERNNAISHLGYNDEGITGYVYPERGHGGAPLYRLYSSDGTDHFYTMSLAERNNAISHLGYNDEGIVAYVFVP